MKEQLKKLKGHTFKLTGLEVTLREPLRPSNPIPDEALFSCSNDSHLCKVVALDEELSRLKFQKETMVYQRIDGVASDVLGQLVASQQVEHKKTPLGLLVFKNPNKPWLLSQEISATKDELSICNILTSVIQGLAALHGKGLAYLNVHPDNVFKSTTNGKFCLLGMQRIVEGGLNNEQFHKNPLVKGNCDSNFKYASPEMLDNYSKQPIDWRADIFMVGCLAYELLYRKYPYETPLAVINLKHQLPAGDQTNAVMKLIKHCLVPYEQRKPSKQILEWLLEELAAKQSNITKKSSMVEVETTFADRFKDALTKMTKESESWIISYTEEGQNEPDIKFVDQLVKKVYKNNGKLEKIYSIICRRAAHKLQCPTSCLKLVTLMWQIIRRGPDCCNSSASKSNFSEAVNLIRSHYKKISGEGLVVEMCGLFSHKQELTEELKGLFEGNFHLTNIGKLDSLTPALLQRIVNYAQIIISAYDKINGSSQWKCADTLVKPILLDELYDLMTQLIVLWVCFMKDNELKKRKFDCSKQLESELESCLKRIKAFGSPPKLHMVTSLDSSLTKYRDAIEFQVVEGVKRSTYELFFNTGKLLCGLILPIDYSKIFLNKTSQEAKKDDRKSPQSTKIIAPDQTISDQEAGDCDFEAKQIRDCENIISLKQASQQSPKRSPKKTPSTIELDDVFAQWGGKQPIKKQTVQQSKIKSFVDIFADFGQPNQAQPKKDAGLDFDMLWKGGNSNGSGSGKGSNNHEKKPEENTPSPPYRKEGALPNSNNVSFSSKEAATNSSGNNSSGNTTHCLPQNSKDLMFFTNNAQPNSSGAPKSTLANNDIFDFSIECKPVEKSASFIALQKEITQSLKNEDLKKLISSSNIVVPWESIKLDKVVGCGSAGEVYLGSYNGKQAAIKKVKSIEQNPSAFKEFEREVVTLIRIGQHPSLVSLLGITKHEGDFYLLMNYCEGGSLFELLHRRIDLALPWKERISMARQIAQAMNYLHTGCGNTIIHRDLKSLNILVQNKIGSAVTEPIHVRVTDFGLSRNPDAQFMTSALGTLHWMAPELLLNKKYSSKIDVYSFGVVLWEICCRTTPYKDFKTPIQIMQYVTAQNGRPDMHCLNEGCPEKLSSLIKACLASDQNQRPTFAALIDELTLLQEQ